jgi:hypothetical protein
VVASLLAAGCPSDDTTGTSDDSGQPMSTSGSETSTTVDTSTGSNGTETSTTADTSASSDASTADTTANDEMCAIPCGSDEVCLPTHYCEGEFRCVATEGATCAPGMRCAAKEPQVCLDSAFDEDPGVCISLATIDTLCAADPGCWQQCPMGATGSTSN